MSKFWYEVGKGVFQAAGKKVEEAKKAEAEKQAAIRARAKAKREAMTSPGLIEKHKQEMKKKMKKSGVE